MGDKRNELIICKNDINKGFNPRMLKNDINKGRSPRMLKNV